MCKFLKDILKASDKGLEAPDSNIEISNIELYGIIKARFPDMPDIFLSDQNFLLCNDDDITSFLTQDVTNKYKYVTEAYDCDNFSYHLMGQFSIPGWARLAFGIIWTDKHALNCFVNEDKELYLVEPQTDEILKNFKAWMGNTPRFIIM